jgi:hypothetical protein
MKQYEYQLINKHTGRTEWARATAAHAGIARAQIVLSYGGQFIVADLFADINPPHHTLGEINCADFPISDIEWLFKKAATIESTI